MGSQHTPPSSRSFMVVSSSSIEVASSGNGGPFVFDLGLVWRISPHAKGVRSQTEGLTVLPAVEYRSILLPQILV